MLCTDYTYFEQREQGIYAAPLRCRRWTCDHCSDMRRRQLVHLARAGAPNTFLTLTVNPAWGASPDERACALKDAWTALRKAAVKKYGYATIPFLAVFERTKRGEPHLHILARVKWIDQAWISAFMDRRMKAPVVDIRRIDDPLHAARYVTKYVGKDPHLFAGTKRYWRSQDWEIGVRDPEEAGQEARGGWWVSNVRFSNYLHQIEAAGLSWTWEGAGVVVEEAPWDRPP